ncbi:hypothetical protein HYV64_00135 [Candidatus Shapirobacteria bacterium]|nr:hypothetical protein [Candidatus Shapirobacteria bacterium]
MEPCALDKSINWPHKRQASTMVAESTNTEVAEVPTTRVTSGLVYNALMQLLAVLKEPEKHPEVTIIYAENS